MGRLSGKHSLIICQYPVNFFNYLINLVANFFLGGRRYFQKLLENMVRWVIKYLEAD